MRKPDFPQRRTMHRACALALAGALSLGAVLPIFAEPTTGVAEAANPNMALGATATASGQEADSTPASGVNDGHNDRESGHRWSSGSTRLTKDEKTRVQLTFPKPVTVGQVCVTFEERTADPKPSNVKSFDIQVKEQGQDGWVKLATVNCEQSGEAYAAQADYKPANHKSITALRLTNFDVKNGSTQWNGVSVCELECYGTPKADETPDKNHVREATLSASATEDAAKLSADKAGDGNAETRWSSGESKPSTNDYLQATFDEDTLVSQVNVAFETRDINVKPSNVKSFDIQYQSAGSSEWKTAKHVVNKVAGDGFTPNVSVELDDPVVASALRLTHVDVKEGDTKWNGVSVCELECYSNEQGVSSQTPEQVLAGLPDNVTIDSGKAQIDVPSVPEGYSIKLNGCDFEQIISESGKVHHPLTDKAVKVSWELTDKKNDKKYVSEDKSYTVKGLHSIDASANVKPAVVPEIQEWHASNSSKLSLDGLETVTYSDESLKAIVDEFMADYKDFTGKQLSVKKGAAIGGAINFIKANPQGDDMLGDEGYRMVIDADSIDVTAPAVTGNMYGAQTILQMTKLYEDGQFPQGEMRDYPRYPVRGLLLDVARKPVSLETMKEITRSMRYYKMNDFQAHLSDNLIFLENYKSEDDALNKSYAAFRLESGLSNGKGETPTAKDYAISKDDFREFIQDERALGMNIVPEIDVPAHSVAFTRVWPELSVKGKTLDLGKNRYAVDHFDLNKPESYEKIKEIFDDYTKGENPTFDEETVVHIGADEFLIDAKNSGAKLYRDFTNKLVPYVKQTNTVRMWGGYTWLNNGPAIAPEAVEDVQMNLWSADWADGVAMYNEGFDLINTIDNFGYMVPNGDHGRANAYGDYLNVDRVFNEFAPEKVRVKGGAYKNIPSSDDQMLGAAFAIWNDKIDTSASGLSEDDLYNRFFDAMPFYAEKTWAATGKEKGTAANLKKVVAEVGDAPQINPYSEVTKQGDVYADYDFNDGLTDGSENGRDLNQGERSVVAGGMLVLEGGKSYVTSPVDKIAAGAELDFDIELTEPACPGDILFEADAPYGTLDIRVMDNGKLGFTREIYDYYFDYVLPVGKKINISIKTKKAQSQFDGRDAEETWLYVDGVKIGKASGRFFDHGMVKKDGIENATLTIPLQRIGSKTNAIAAKIDGVTVRPSNFAAAPDAPAEDFHKEQWKGTTNSFTADKKNEHKEGLLEYAWDGKESSHWHSNWGQATGDNVSGDLTVTPMVWAEIDLGKAYAINQFSFTPRIDTASGYITKANLKIKRAASDEWTEVAHEMTFKADGSKKTFYFEEQEVQHIRLEVLDSGPKQSNGKKWVAVSEFDVDRKPAPTSSVYARAMGYLKSEGDALDMSTGELCGSITGSVEDHIDGAPEYRGEVSRGSKVVLTATPDQGMEFVGWFAPCSVEPISTDATLEVMASQNVVLEARFSRAKSTPIIPLDPSKPVEKPGTPLTPIGPSDSVEKPEIPLTPLDPSKPMEEPGESTQPHEEDSLVQTGDSSMLGMVATFGAAAAAAGLIAKKRRL